MTTRFRYFGFWIVNLLPAACLALSAAAEPAHAPRVLCLDGPGWWLSTDPQNAGRGEEWFRARRAEAKATRVPWIIQDAFPGYHGVAWYWREFQAPENPWNQGRCLLRFWAVDYQAEVWLNGRPVGAHEGGESPFTLDVTGALRPGATNLLSLRVLNPTHTPIDGIVLAQTPHRNKALPYSPGSAWNQGGIMDSVELLLAPAVRVGDVHAQPDLNARLIRVHTRVHNAATNQVRTRLEWTVAPAASGETLVAERTEGELPPGDSWLEAELRVAQPRLWDIDDPFLYRVTARLSAEEPAVMDEQSVRCGFREFRFQDGWFRLNGRRLYLRSSHTGNCTPIGLELPHHPDILRRDLINAKMMRFNCIRFIAGVAKRYQLDLCDEIGLMVYEESYAGWCLADSPQMARRYTESVLGMVQRDRNHPSVVIWGLLNETADGPVFRQAAGLLPALRQIDNTRLVLLNSGRWDAQGGDLAGLQVWRPADQTDPCVTYNPTDHALRGLGITWAPGQIAFHPGQRGQYAVVRWTAPATEQVDCSVEFQTIAERATTDVHLLHNGRELFRGFINVQGGGPRTNFTALLDVRAGDNIECAVGLGNGDYGADTTALAFRLKTTGGKTFDAAADFSIQQNPHGPWSYGQMAPGPAPETRTFLPFPNPVAQNSLGSLSNPGSEVWEDLLVDRHYYPRVPHTPDIIRTLRQPDDSGRPLFLSEYGIGSAVDLIRAARHYEQCNAQHAMDAQFYRTQLDRFVDDWKRWRLDQAFARPEDFFTESNARMAGQRLLGLNAIRSNPGSVGYSLTGTVDQGMTGEGCWTTFRELKPGTTDALFEGWAPLRWCLFVEPLHVYRGAKVRVEAVLANEDILPPGSYPARLQIVGPGQIRLLDRAVTVTLPARASSPSSSVSSAKTPPGPAPSAEPPMVVPVFAEDFVIDGPSGAYRFLATLEKGGAAAGGEAAFHITDPADMPAVGTVIVLWGQDPELAKWLAGQGLPTRLFQPGTASGREVILVSGQPPAPGDASVFRALVESIARGATVLFLTPALLAKDNNPAGWVPLPNKGRLETLPAWLYHKDDWCKPHPAFAGLPSGGLMDWVYYRELISDVAFVGQDPPAEALAGGINAAVGYSSGLTLAVHRLGGGRFILNTLRIRENLGSQPAAERLLRNLLNFAAGDSAQPLAELPPDWAEQIKRLGY